MERNCVSFETAKKLKAAGLEIDAPTFGWQNFEGEWVIHSWDEIDEDNEWYIAFTAQEIWDELPPGVRGKGNLEIWLWDDPAGRNSSSAYVDHNKKSSMFSPAKTLAESLAALYLKLNKETT